jgi:thiamine kinase-like enzyme
VSKERVNAAVLAELQSHLPGWAELAPADVVFEPPKGFSSFTMVVRPQVQVDPPGVLYRRLAGKDNAILEPEAERDVFLLLGRAGIAAACLHQDPGCRIEELLSGGTLTREDVFDSEVLRKVAVELHHFHHLEPPPLPEAGYFELLHDKWGPMARSVLQDQRDKFPAHERHLCDDLLELVTDRTRDAVQRMLPDGPLTFCHNDTYHGNVMKLDDGSVRLLDFEFSCMNHLAFDFSNLFAETVMRHGLAEEPHFDIAPPDFGRDQISVLVNHYLDCDPSLVGGAREARAEQLIQETLQLIPLSDYMYAMAALPLAVMPIQKIRFLPYAHRRFRRFQAAAAQP